MVTPQNSPARRTISRSENGEYSMTANENNPVGYGSPPVATRFKPGQSGNPSGRPKKSKNLKAELLEELEELTSVTEDGMDTKVTKARAIAKAVVREAASGNMRAITALMSLFVREDSGSETSHETAEESALLANFVDREIRRRAHASSSSNGNDTIALEHKEREDE
jgi:hypothetical protein